MCACVEPLNDPEGETDARDKKKNKYIRKKGEKKKKGSDKKNKIK